MLKFLHYPLKVLSQQGFKIIPYLPQYKLDTSYNFDTSWEACHKYKSLSDNHINNL